MSRAGVGSTQTEIMYVIFRGKEKFERACPSMMSFTAENEAQNKPFNQYGRNNPIVLLTRSRIILSLFVRGLRVAIHLKATYTSTLANKVMDQIG